MKACKPNQIRNPDTNRCVKKSGVIGKKILSGKRKSSKKKSKTINNRLCKCKCKNCCCNKPGKLINKVKNCNCKCGNCNCKKSHKK